MENGNLNKKEDLWEILTEISKITGDKIETILYNIGIFDGSEQIKIFQKYSDERKNSILKNAVKEFQESQKNRKTNYRIEIVYCYLKLKNSKALRKYFLGEKNTELVKFYDKRNEKLVCDLVTINQKWELKDLKLKTKLQKEIGNIFDKVINMEDLDLILKDPEDFKPIIEYILLNMDEDKRRDIPKVNEKLKKFFKDNMQFIDIDKFLLLTATRLILGIKKFKGEELDDEIKEGAFAEIQPGEEEETLKNTVDILKNIKKELEKRAESNPEVETLEQTLYNSNDEEIITVNLDYIKEFLREHQENKKNEEEVKILSPEEIAKDLKEKQGLSDEKIMQMYIAGEISKDVMINLELKEEYCIDVFKKLYAETQNSKEDEEQVKTENLKRFSELCDTLIEQKKLDKENLLLEFMESYGNEKTYDLFKLGVISFEDCFDCMGEKVFKENFIDDKITISQDILKRMSSRKKIKEDDIYNLYTKGAISLEDCFDCIGLKALQKIFSSGNISIQPAVLKKMYDNGKINNYNLVNLINKLPTDEEKYVLIINIFPEEPNIRDEIINKTISVDSGLITGRKQKAKKTKSNTTKADGSFSKRTITDSAERFNLIQNCDPNCYIEMLKDGHILFVSYKINKVIIEKIRDTQDENGYGAATYAVDEKYFKDHEEDIIKDKKIDRTSLVKAYKEGAAKRAIHSSEKRRKNQTNGKKQTWGDKIKKLFEEESGVPFTDEENQKLDEIIKRIQESEKTI